MEADFVANFNRLYAPRGAQVEMFYDDFVATDEAVPVDLVAPVGGVEIDTVHRHRECERTSHGFAPLRKCRPLLEQSKKTGVIVARPPRHQAVKPVRLDTFVKDRDVKQRGLFGRKERVHHWTSPGF